MIPFFAIAMLFGKPETERIDRLISGLNNNQIEYVVVHYAGGGFRLFSKEIDSLFVISHQIDIRGKRIYKDIVHERLVSFLTDTARGVAVHFLISRVNGSCFSSCFRQIVGEKYEYNGLEIARDSSAIFRSTLPALETNKLNWTERLR